MSALEFTVRGVPAPQGSKKAFVVQRQGGPARAVVVDDNKASLRTWRQDVKAAAEDRLGNAPQLVGPVRLRVVFAMPRPKSAPKTRRTWPTTKPDGDKLLRAICDSLKDAGVYRDDAQVVAYDVAKDYVGYGPATDFPWPGARIRVEAYSDDTTGRLL